MTDKTTLITEDLHYILKVEASKAGMKLNEYMDLCIRKGMKVIKDEAKAEKVSK